jgi:hypothetical protein
MRKERTDKNKIFRKGLTKKELKNHISKNLDNLKFQEHCEEVARNLNVDVVVVRELLEHNSFMVLSLLQKAVIENKVIKINITGFIIFMTVLIKYKIRNLSFYTKNNKFY